MFRADRLSNQTRHPLLRYYFPPTTAPNVLAYEQVPSEMNPAETKTGSKYIVTYKQGKALLLFFIVWKCLLFAVAALAPGPGYDTSALILSNPDLSRHERFKEQSFVENVALKLFRWDAFYFIQAARRDKVHEQEWAFSWAYSRMIRVMTECKRISPDHHLKH